jgi:sugar phosphate isomerase/epimerase
MLLGYNTNGLAHHDPLDAIRLLASIGYRSVAITIDHRTLNPEDPDLDGQIAAVAMLLEEYGLRSVIETGARFLLDPLVKHEPTLMTADPAARDRRVKFLQGAINIASELGSDCVSLWSGILRDDASEEVAFDRLETGLREVLDHAADRGMVIGFEPEPGMFIDTMAKYEQLIERIDVSQLRLTLDVGHLHCQGETPLHGQIRRWHQRLVNVHIEDMRRGKHEHLMFGEGDMDFPPVIAALKEIGYTGGLHVELSRHSHDGPAAARQAFDFLEPLL